MVEIIGAALDIVDHAGVPAIRDAMCVLQVERQDLHAVMRRREASRLARDGRVSRVAGRIDPVAIASRAV